MHSHKQKNIIYIVFIGKCRSYVGPKSFILHSVYVYFIKSSCLFLISVIFVEYPTWIVPGPNCSQMCMSVLTGLANANF